MPLYGKKISPAARSGSADCEQTGVPRDGVGPFHRKDRGEREIVCAFKRLRCFSVARYRSNGISDKATVRLHRSRSFVLFRTLVGIERAKRQPNFATLSCQGRSKVRNKQNRSRNFQRSNENINLLSRSVERQLGENGPSITSWIHNRKFAGIRFACEILLLRGRLKFARVREERLPRRMIRLTVIRPTRPTTARYFYLYHCP